MNLTNYFSTTIALFLIIFLRYVGVAGLFYWLLWKRDSSRARRLFQRPPKAAAVRAEVFWSVIASLIFAVPGTVMIEIWKEGGTAIYTELSWSDLWYIPFSVGLYLFLHDTYFYWTHRWMHRPKLFQRIHKIHHDSRPPTPWAAFSFHPYESVIGALIIPVLAFLIPIHVGGLLFILTVMTVCSVINHAGFEIFPERWMNGRFGEHLITATHHHLHHSRYNTNYALYFRFWDKVMGTDAMP